MPWWLVAIITFRLSSSTSRRRRSPPSSLLSCIPATPID
ncbi:hypothetical protein BofuT4_uP137880.1 [Botrytis cinerea T4]|uniref:Uncharacterized protein n=1 Tax=Botryotinia fuckeliana (strain T4) TaxID=999810 RepID=G2YML6_BOTF4|nr:hypothetical protein BofuT4_uP137880.1 [Botrytis cinerea T4]